MKYVIWYRGRRGALGWLADDAGLAMSTLRHEAYEYPEDHKVLIDARKYPDLYQIYPVR